MLNQVKVSFGFHSQLPSRWSTGSWACGDVSGHIQVVPHGHVLPLLGDHVPALLHVVDLLVMPSLGHLSWNPSLECFGWFLGINISSVVKLIIQIQIFQDFHLCQCFVPTLGELLGWRTDEAAETDLIGFTTAFIGALASLTGAFLDSFTFFLGTTTTLGSTSLEAAILPLRFLLGCSFRLSR